MKCNYSDPAFVAKVRDAWDEVQRTRKPLGGCIVVLDDGTVRLSERIGGKTESDMWWEDDAHDHVVESIHADIVDEERFGIREGDDGRFYPDDDKWANPPSCDTWEDVWDVIIAGSTIDDEVFDRWWAQVRPPRA